MVLAFVVVLVLSSVLVCWLFNKYQFSSVQFNGKFKKFKFSGICQVVTFKFTLPLVPIKLSQTASKYGESHNSLENSDFFYGVKKTLLVNFFQKYAFKVPVSSHFSEIWEISKYSSINQDGRLNSTKIVHFQLTSTETRELAWILYSHSL